jgi:hypothetical protein
LRAHEIAVALVLLSAGCAAKEAPPAMAPNDSRGGARDRTEMKVVAMESDSPAPAPAPPPPAPSGNYNAAPAEPPPPPPPPPPKSEPAKADAAQKAPQNRDFVIYTAQFTMAVYQVETGIAAIEKIAREHDGYLSAKKDREIIIRVPRAQFEAAVSQVDKVGDVLHRDIAALDVTDEHVDLEIRIKNARAMQKHLTDLLARANVKEALEIEKELGRITEELERLEGRLKLMNDKIAFSTIAVQFEARGQALTTQRVRLPFPWLNTLNLPNLLNLSEDK